MKVVINKEYKVSNVHEISVDCLDDNFLIIYGKHINGWFIAVPNWGICTEAGEPTSDYYNAEKLRRVTTNENAPEVIAKAVRKHYEMSNQDNTD